MFKRFIPIIFLLALLPSLMGMGVREKTDRQDALHEIAETARALGLPEDDPIIRRAQELWWDAENDFRRDRDIIATVVYNEAWGGCSTRQRELTAAVVVNRVKSDKFPNTVYDVVTQKGQYLTAYAYPDSRAGKLARANPEIWKECQRIATKALNGEVKCDERILYQATFRQGYGVYEVHHTSYSTTYFCYG